MEFSLNQTNLKQALQYLQKAIPSKASLPILTSILIEATEKQQIKLAATDLFLGITTQIPGTVKQPGKIAVPGDIFKQLVMSLDAKEINFQLEENTLLLKAGRSQAKIAVQNTQDYPAFPDIEGQTFTLDQDTMKNIEQLLTFCVGTDQTRPVLTTVLLNFHDQQLEAAATDGFRLGLLNQDLKLSEPPAKTTQVAKTKPADPDATEITETTEHNELAAPAEQAPLLLPAKVVPEICKIMQQTDCSQLTLTVSTQLKQLKIQVAETEFFIRLIEGDFPPYQKIVPADFAWQVGLDAGSLEQELKRAAIMARDASNIVKFKLDKAGLTITATSPAFGQYQGQINTDETFKEEFEIAFNVRYLLDFLQAVKAEKLIFMANESLKPAMFKVAGVDQYRYIVMPFKVNQ